MVALRSRRGHDRRIGNRGAVVAAYRSRHAGGDGDDHQLMVAVGKYRNNDRNQDPERAPGGSGRKRQEAAYQEDKRREKVHQAARAGLHQVRHIDGGAQAVRHRLQRPGKGQDQDRRYHSLKSFRHTGHTLFKGQDLSCQVDNNCTKESEKASHGQSFGRVAVGERFYEADSVKESAGIDHSDHAEYDQRKDGNHQIHHLAFSLDLHTVRIRVRSVRRGIKIIFLHRVFLVKRHKPIIKAGNGDKDHHGDGQQSVKVVRDRSNEQRESVLPLYKAGNSSRPGGNRRDDAHGSRRCVDNIRQLRPGDVMPVCHRTHHASYGQAVKVIVDKDQHAQYDRRQLSADPGTDPFTRPLAEGGGTAGLVHQRQTDRNYRRHQRPECGV